MSEDKARESAPFGRIDAAIFTAVVVWLGVDFVQEWRTAPEAVDDISYERHKEQERNYKAADDAISARVDELERDFEQEKEVSDELSNHLTEVESDLRHERQEREAREEIQEKENEALWRDLERIDRDIDRVLKHLRGNKAANET